MKQSILQFELHTCMEHLSTYRAVFRTKHGRILYLELSIIDEDLLSVIENELDKKFYGIQFLRTDQADLPLDLYFEDKDRSFTAKVPLPDHGRRR